MPEFRVLKGFTDADGFHATDTVVHRDIQTDEDQEDVDAMVRYGMLQLVSDAPPRNLTPEEMLEKTKHLRRG